MLIDLNLEYIWNYPVGIDSNDCIGDLEQGAESKTNNSGNSMPCAYSNWCTYNQNLGA